MHKRTMINFMAGLLLALILSLNSWALGSLPSGDECLSSEKGVVHARLSSEVVFIDPSVLDAETIVAQLSENEQVVRLLPGMDGVAQISAHLAAKKDLSTIRIISHGNTGHFVLNGKRIDEDFLRDHGDRIRAISAVMSQDTRTRTWGM